MAPAFALSPSPAGLLLAAAAVALGAPLFSDGLRAMRLRRHLSGLRRTSLTPATHGFVHATGEVALESPLFSPLGGVPCAGFMLEVEGEGTALRRVVEVHRPFRIVDGGVGARVPAVAQRWVVGVTATRRVAATEALSENLAALMARHPEVAWLRRNGAALLLTERALHPGHVCHVVGMARSAASIAYASSVELAMTGTDAEPEVVLASPELGAAARSDEPALAFGPGEHLEFLRVGDREPSATELHVSLLRVFGVVLGPALSLIGILYIAAVADLLRASGRL